MGGGGRLYLGRGTGGVIPARAGATRAAIRHPRASATAGATPLPPRATVRPVHTHADLLPPFWLHVHAHASALAPTAAEVESLWLEYEAASSPEALLVKDFDKLEMIITATQYEQVGAGGGCGGCGVCWGGRWYGRGGGVFPRPSVMGGAEAW